MFLTPFFSHRSVRNFVIDVRRFVQFLRCLLILFFIILFPRRVSAEKSQGTGLHWQVAQATSLMNIVVQMSTAPNTAHQGKYFCYCLDIVPVQIDLRYLDGEWKVYVFMKFAYCHLLMRSMKWWFYGRSCIQWRWEMPILLSFDLD